MVILVFGLPGSGKSWFARQLARTINADYLSSDELRIKMFSSRTYTEKEKLVVYDQMLKLAINDINKNKSVVLDATFYTDNIRKRFFGLPVKTFPIEIVAGETLIKERLKKKRVDSEADFSVYGKIKSAWEPMKEPHLIIQSGSDNLKSMLTTALNFLLHKNDPPANQ